MSRKLLGKWTSAIARVRVYELPDSLEVESNEQLEVSRRRVFFDDVRLVTFHRRRGVAYLLTTGVIALVSNGLIAFGFTLGREAGTVMAIMMGIVAVPSTIAFLLRSIWALDIVTVYGRRSRGSIRFLFRKRRAREVYDHICTVVREAQQRKAEEYEAEAARSSPESPALPLPPGPPPL